MDIRIDESGILDAQLLAQLGAQTFYDAFASFNKEEDMDDYMNTSFSEQRIAEEMIVPGAVFYIAYKDDKAIGFAKTGQKEPPAEIAENTCRELERIYVLKEYQSMKAGEKLLNHCIAKAKEDGLEVLWLGVWEHNNRAVSFYQRLGFERLGQHTFMLGSDAQTDWLFKLKLR
ncbi:MAG: GNAT family N-acetyltransferase [Sphingobacteriales bacterium]|nr:MAG: GNAT family N-acetyltransferase [Sphingobacteriales bacterium]